MPAPATDLTTKAAVKATYGITDTTLDAVFDRLISAASLFVAKYCARPFIVASFTETRNGNGRSRIVLNNYPVVSVTSVTVDNSAVPARTSPTGVGYTLAGSSIYLNGY